MRVLGVDPGLQCVGYGVVESNDQGISFPSKGRNKSFKLIEAGIIRTTARQKLPLRLKKIYSGLVEVVQTYHPQVLALEELFSHYKNPKTAIMMAHARGVICLVAAQENIPVIGYAPKKIKKAITGAGAAQKAQVQKVIKEMLGLKEIPQPNDVADALAIAITHINISSRQI
ncbi:MAG: crossover junction endodeoxyribonuclease RuvC [Candidatus Omnitrophica bacterium]|nr:crossover junction endodeoxyribonuclease RuvC [Candidatus Omnitrophota bacterium]